jgi:hypothetical protein
MEFAMDRPFRFALTLVLAGGLAAPALAQHDHGDGRHDQQRHPRGHHGQLRHRMQDDCPRGLAWRGGECRRPHREAHQARHHRPGIGERLSPTDYRRIADPGRYALESRDDWNYYRDDNQIYRVDRKTRKVLAVLELIQAFSN